MSETASTEFTPQWGIVEVFGHNRFAGMVSQVSVFGGAMCRVDVPEVPAYTDRWENEHPAVPAFTKMFGAGAIYSFTPVDEATAIAAARQNSAPISVYIEPVNPLPGRQLAMLTDGDGEENDDPTDSFHDQ
jgi:hypothetical protein